MTIDHQDRQGKGVGSGNGQPAVLTTELKELIEEFLEHETVDRLVGGDESAIKAIYDIRSRGRIWTTYWRADRVLSAMGRPDLLQLLTQRE